MSNRSIHLISNARMGSTRLPKKMLRPFWNGDTLFSMLIRRMKRLVEIFPFQGHTLAIHAGDIQLIHQAVNSGLEVKFRSDKSVKSAALCDIYDYLADIDCEYFMWVNGSQPFWTPDCAAAAARLFAADGMRSMTSVIRRKNWFWDSSQKPLTLPEAGGATQDSGDLYEATHAFHIFPKSMVLNWNSYWQGGSNDPYLFEVEKSECLADVDNKEDFDLADAILMRRDVHRCLDQL